MATLQICIQTAPHRDALQWYNGKQAVTVRWKQNVHISRSTAKCHNDPSFFLLASWKYKGGFLTGMNNAHGECGSNDTQAEWVSHGVVLLGGLIQSELI